MSHRLPGFVDHHAHLLRTAVGGPLPYDPQAPETVAAWHRSVAWRSSTPVDEPDRPLTVDDATRGGIERALEEAARDGLVEITEAGITDWAYLDALLALRQRGPLPLRVRLLVASGIAEPSRMRRLGDPWLEVIGVKLYADGWLGPRTCALSRPFVDEPEQSGVLFLTSDQVARRAEPFAEDGWTIATHAIGDRAIAAVLDGYELLYGSDCAAAAPRIEHAQVLRADLIERMAALGIVACVQPSFAVADAADAKAALDRDWPLAYDWESLGEAGVTVVTGSDYPIADLAPLVGLQHLVTGAPVDAPGRRVAPTLPLPQALEILTDAAAGVTVLDTDPFDVDPGDLHRIDVVGTEPAAGPTR